MSEATRICPFGEICWYITDNWEQFRISGSIDTIDGSIADHAKLQMLVSKIQGICINFWEEASHVKKINICGTAKVVLTRHL
ncbi:unnamed protein product [Urochloa humidicola]